jgi:hypothetical protein
MNEIRLRWEPKSLVSEHELEKCLLNYTNSKGGVSLLRNGTVLFIKSSGNDTDDAKKSMDEARFLRDFEIQPMDDGNYLVIFHSAVSVFVSSNEFNSRKQEILKRMDDLKFPSEVFVYDANNNGDGFLLGLYARGKLQKDAYEFEFLKRI